MCLALSHKAQMVTDMHAIECARDHSSSGIIPLGCLLGKYGDVFQKLLRFLRRGTIRSKRANWFHQHWHGTTTAAAIAARPTNISAPGESPPPSLSLPRMQYVVLAHNGMVVEVCIVVPPRFVCIPATVMMRKQEGNWVGGNKGENFIERVASGSFSVC